MASHNVFRLSSHGSPPTPSIGSLLAQESSFARNVPYYISYGLSSNLTKTDFRKLRDSYGILDSVILEGFDVPFHSCLLPFFIIYALLHCMCFSLKTQLLFFKIPCLPPWLTRMFLAFLLTGLPLLLRWGLFWHQSPLPMVYPILHRL